MIYFDNSATTFFKPDCVKNAVYSAMSFLSANPGRGSHSMSLKAASLVYRARKAIAGEIGLDNADRIIFTPSCSDALNLAIIGSMKKELSKNERVTFIPFVSDIKLLAKYYSMADVFVHFSIEDTFGKVIAEAQACGTPAIVYNATACSEIARIGNGYVCEPRDVDQVYNMIEKLSKMDKASLTSDRIVRAEKTSKTLNKNTRIKNLLKLYKQAIENKTSLISKEIRDREI